MKTKLLTLALCCSLALAPTRIAADDNGGGDMIVACCVAVVCVAVGAVIVVGVHKMCKHLDNMSKPPVDDPPALPPYYITNGVLCTNFTIVHPRMAVLRMPTTTGSTMALQSSTAGGAWAAAYHFDMSDGPSGLTVVVSDAAGVPVTTNTFAVTSDGTNRWALCAFPQLPITEHPNQLFRLQTTQ